MILNWIFILILFIKNLSSESNRNPHFDFLTGILHHAQHTKTCGSLLQQTHTLDFEHFWIEKFAHYIERATRLASALDHLIDEYADDDEYLKRIDESILSSFNYFVFSNDANNNPLDVVKQDDFIMSYGLVFSDDQIYQKCIYSSTSDNDNGFLYSSELCPDNNNNNKSKIETFDENKLVNCNSWYINLYNSYNKSLSIIKDENLSFLQADQKYETFLKQILLNKEFLNSQWCGPLYECKSNNSYNWILIYSTPLFNAKFEFKGALTFKLNLSNLDVNQCDGDDLFSNTHKCKNNSKCNFIPNNGFKLGGYSCVCESMQMPNLKVFNGSDIEREYWLLKNMKSNRYNESFNCIECKYDCCNDCKYNYNQVLKKVILIVQSFMILISILTALVTYKLRNIKVEAHFFFPFEA